MPAIKCAIAGCVGKARTIVTAVYGARVSQVQMCKPCARAYKAGAASGWNSRIEWECERAMINAGY